MASTAILSPLLETVRVRGLILRAFLLGSAGLGVALGLTSVGLAFSSQLGLSADHPIFLVTHLPGRLVFFGVLLAFLAWASACQQAVQGLLGRSLDLNIPLVIAAFFCVPLVGVILPVRAILKLADAVDPSSLPPVVVEQAREGGFREDVLRRVETGSIDRPMVWLWGGCWVGAQVCPFVLAFFANRAQGYLLSAILDVLAAVLMLRTVRAISHNLTESYRRILFRLGTDPDAL